MAQQRLFLRHLRVYWDVHRYLPPPHSTEAVERKQADGSLRVVAASLNAAAIRDGQFNLTLRPRDGEGNASAVSADAVVVTTGPAHATMNQSNALLAMLGRRGMIRPDGLALGLDVDVESRAIDAHGQANPTLCVVGPLARAQFGELIGISHIAVQAGEIARYIHQRLDETLPLQQRRALLSPDAR